MKKPSSLRVCRESGQGHLARKAHQVDLVGQIDRACDDAFRGRTQPQKKFATVLADEGDGHSLELVEDPLHAGMDVNKLRDDDHGPTEVTEQRADERAGISLLARRADDCEEWQAAR
jgi:hypothetical protein